MVGILCCFLGMGHEVITELNSEPSMCEKDFKYQQI